MDQAVNIFFSSVTGNPDDFLFSLLSVPIIIIIFGSILRPLE